MAFDFASVKAQTRRVVHDTLGVDALYQDNVVTTPVPIRVRWHNRINRFGDLESAGYAEIIEGIDRVILNGEQARLIGVRSRGRIFMPATMGSAVLTLSAQEPKDGPFEECWTVSKDLE
jgi:hypothetical protein